MKHKYPVLYIAQPNLFNLYSLVLGSLTVQVPRAFRRPLLASAGCWVLILLLWLLQVCSQLSFLSSECSSGAYVIVCAALRRVHFLQCCACSAYNLPHLVHALGSLSSHVYSRAGIPAGVPGAQHVPVTVGCWRGFLPCEHHTVSSYSALLR